ncbi:auxin response factor 4-like isoform X2 [Abrus precatorius]|uniref:Auxin response factor n=1 Tax=Abrus precatorius TaxID=3816 RepID=A0A8B8KT46_ABRPR|nr:auxin response factor 4-like isoform X2 [Abrus precatorius]
MEIDLNHEVTEVEKNAFCDRECEKGACVRCWSSSTCSSSSSSSALVSSSYLELWHACAGPLTSLPKKGNVVVYFPQGHLEQVASFSPFTPLEIPTYDLQPQIFCRVVNVQLLANKENDEVYTQVTLLPQSELSGMNSEGKEVEEMGAEEESDERSPTKSTPHMFCKTLTASDTSTHGGFSVPRRAAEDCFPPLDYKQQRPSQELVAKDLHGVEWKFRHIYRGQPRRHLLTTGWSIFVSQKNLVSGDAVLFLRGENGELRLGIRRAVRPRNGLPESIIGSQNCYPNFLSSVANAISTKSMFHVFYSPRASHADFVVPYKKYVKSIKNPMTIGTRFKMRFEMDESQERRCSGGTLIGTSDLDPYRWPKSKWRCLMVRWDEDIETNHQDRVSPWEIDLSAPLPPLSIQSSPRLKKLRTGLQAASQSHLITGGSGLVGFEESVRSPKVLQGQENAGFVSLYYGCDTVTNRPGFEMSSPSHPNLASAGVRKVPSSELSSVHPFSYAGFMETNRFPRVLQGQEMCPLKSLTGKVDLNLGAWGKPNLSCTTFNLHQATKPNFQSPYFPYGDIHQTGQASLFCSKSTSFQRENVPYNSPSTKAGIIINEVGRSDLPNEHKLQDNISAAAASLGAASMAIPNDNNVQGKVNACKLFGFPLSGETTNQNSQNSAKRSCTKVHKQGSLVGRAIDLSRLSGYNDLLSELERLFGMEGLLKDPDKGWRILYTDSENDIMVVGDDPWHEFCDVVSKIHIYTQEEVEKMTIGMISDDTNSCLEQAPVIMEASKSSSVGQPDYSPTAVRV